MLPDLEGLKTRLTQVEEENKNLRNAADNDDELGKLKADIQQLRCRNIKLEAYTRRKNIKIFNLPEIRGETPSDTEVLASISKINI